MIALDHLNLNLQYKSISEEVDLNEIFSLELK